MKAHKFSTIRTKDVIRWLEAQGFQWDNDGRRGEGSHRVYIHHNHSVRVRLAVHPTQPLTMRNAHDLARTFGMNIPQLAECVRAGVRFYE